MSQPMTEVERAELVTFANRLVPDYASAIGGFFDVVVRRQRDLELTNDQVIKALAIGYGEDIADEFEEWLDG